MLLRFTDFAPMPILLRRGLRQRVVRWTDVFCAERVEGRGVDCGFPIWNQRAVSRQSFDRFRSRGNLGWDPL